MEKKEEILRVRNLDISFETTAGVVNAVRGVNLTVNRGETVAIVGESGSGKSVSAKAIMGILAKNGTIDRGQITFSYYRNPEERVTREILQMKKEEIRRHINGKRIAMVFQDPMTSLNPLMPVGKQIMEGMIWHYHTPKEEAYEKALELMKLVGITDAEKRIKNYPHQLSGGMRQRIVIAIALACDPELLICDEPTTALDVTIQSKILELIQENNAKGEKTVMIVPYGPLGPYARLVELINKHRVSLKNCWFINMDEYLDENKQYLPKTDPLSFRGGMDRIFYGLVDPELLMPEEQRIFPEPGNEGRIWETIQKLGKLDMCWGGVGITGHIAFNEPPEPGEVCTDEEFLQRPTRVLKLARETKTINAFMNAGADLDAIPDWCITVGMKEIFHARKVRMCMPRDWNAAMLRKALHGPVSCKVPVSLFQNHGDAKIYAIALAATTPVIPEIRVYNN